MNSDDFLAQLEGTQGSPPVQASSGNDDDFLASLAAAPEASGATQDSFAFPASDTVEAMPAFGSPTAMDQPAMQMGDSFATDSSPANFASMDTGLSGPMDAPAFGAMDGMSAPAAAYTPPDMGFGMPNGTNGAIDAHMEQSALREWERAHEQELTVLAGKESAEKKQTREGATSALNQWYDERKAETTQKASQNRKEEAEFVSSRDSLATAGTPWERVASLCDFTHDSSNRDTSRMKSLLLRLKAKPA